MTITYIKGDATKPVVNPINLNYYNDNHNDNQLIIHICNNIGKWGLGFVLALSKRWKEPEMMYKSLNQYQLGTTQFVKIPNTNITVANMIAQNGINNKYSKKICRVDYEGLKKCLQQVNSYVLENKCSIHMPKIGTGLAYGDWSIIENLIKNTIDNNINVYVYLID